MWTIVSFIVAAAIGLAAYQGYADPYLSDWQHQYYGSSLERLRAIKQKYDPDNIFRYPQSIPPA